MGNVGALTDYMTECRELVTDEIRRLFGHDGPNAELYDLMLDYPLREGKALRPTLAIATCRALGGYLEAVLPTAATLELYHNAFLIHDDVEDDSVIRRGGPTLHIEHGVPVAVNVGDAMLVLSLGPLLQNVAIIGLGPALKVLGAVSEMSRESVEGQALELAWVRANRWDLDDDDYRRMVTKKTGWYSFITPMRLGATVAGVDESQAIDVIPFARDLGIAFQITDDLLNLRSAVDEYGKEIGGDLWEGKRTVILLHAVRTATVADRDRAVEILGKDRPVSQKSAHDRVLAERLIDESGSMGYAAAVARRHAEAARDHLDRLTWLPHNRHRLVLEALVDFVHERSR